MVALARKLLIALWKYLEWGEVPGKLGKWKKRHWELDSGSLIEGPSRTFTT
jgi:hypothetical protein